MFIYSQSFSHISSDLEHKMYLCASNNNKNKIIIYSNVTRDALKRQKQQKIIGKCSFFSCFMIFFALKKTFIVFFIRKFYCECLSGQFMTMWNYHDDLHMNVTHDENSLITRTVMRFWHARVRLRASSSFVNDIYGNNWSMTRNCQGHEQFSHEKFEWSACVFKCFSF